MRNNLFLLLLAVVAASGLAGCLRLDDNLFNNNEHQISQYRLSEYTGEVDFTLDGSYAIPGRLVHLLTLSSQGPGEAKGTKIYAVYIGDTTRIATDTVIMYCHGNKDHLDFYWPRAQLLANAGAKNRYGVLMVDYRGYGLSEGKPTEAGLYNDVDAALQWLRGKGLTGNRLIMYGFSMGSAPAVLLTAQPRSLTPAKLILEAPYASAQAIVQDAAVLALPGTFVTDLSLDNGELIKQVPQPLLWLHGTDDHYLSLATQGEVVYNNHRGAYKEAHRVAGAHHSDVPVYYPFRTYAAEVGKFIRR